MTVARMLPHAINQSASRSFQTLFQESPIGPSSSFSHRDKFVALVHTQLIEQFLLNFWRKPLLKYGFPVRRMVSGYFIFLVT